MNEVLAQILARCVTVDLGDERAVLVLIPEPVDDLDALIERARVLRMEHPEWQS